MEGRGLGPERDSGVSEGSGRELLLMLGFVEYGCSPSVSKFCLNFVLDFVYSEFCSVLCYTHNTENNILKK